ncbi:hypothetical protein IW261DRAFT_1570369 [Armillaria novae-zelandiae]|uniref:Uncharacterized protein n=1 Tax=Armillaria novae-zelandiae TaxID=153914 RepID=A0AA39NW70_9AGAR|nr:hypothetical protein IW261DRAFT_1570369 [Armillaria novae-zelandiae]
MISTPRYDQYPTRQNLPAWHPANQRRGTHILRYYTPGERARRSSKAKELCSATAFLLPPAYTTLDFISIVGATSPYNINIVEIMANSVDHMFASFGSAILEYLYLAEDLSDAGVIGVDMGPTYKITPAAALTEHGGVIHDPSSIEAGNGWRFPKWSRS